MPHMPKAKGFTLVELAIVVTIIGLLIGGVIKGQEIIENAGMTSAWSKMKSIEGAVATFKTTYRDLPGDMTRPAERLVNCSESPCNVAGDGNGWIGWVTGQGNTGYTATGEQNTFWLHLQAAGLMEVPAPDPDAGNSTYIETGMGSPKSFLQVQSWPYEHLNSDSVHWFYMWRRPSTNPVVDMPMNKLGRFDSKFDDGMPFAGTIQLNGSVCGSATMSTSSTSYDPSDVTLCLHQIKARF